ncbi:Hypothetical Protein FCC1311_118182 [Hondaea fermentalgiana]|uniref:Uncharacterized protein n=1 Tax=Hondaea fermentalgiana TaxID=2315210 RepID=A0A2R5FJF1_9STRA|nr:Hypothetical Protein FCC1311_118182 [Hondaea fermentalgiana]|eukprot:GBG16343.1 Hypothetical Protein FCC1311_118182 [Hondaea fermentalgiana]
MHYCKQAHNAVRAARNIFNIQSKAFAKGDLRPAQKTASTISNASDAQGLRRSINRLGLGAQKIYDRILMTDDPGRCNIKSIPAALIRLSDIGTAIATLPYHLHLSKASAKLLNAEKVPLKKLRKLTFSILKADALNDVSIG